MGKRRKRELAVSIIALCSIAVGFVLCGKYLKNVSADDSSYIITETSPVNATTTQLPVANKENPTLVVGKKQNTTVPIHIAPQPTESLAFFAPAPTQTPVSAPAQVQATPQAQTQTPDPTPTTPPVAQTSTPRFTLPYSIGTFGNGFGNGDGWSAWWGSIAQNGGILTVGASNESSGGGVALDGSEGWGNYTFQANVDWIKGETFGIVARYIDNKNYVLCDFDEPSVGDVRMNLEQFVDGKQINLANGDIPNYEGTGGANINVAIQVQGSAAACAFNGYAISTIFATTALSGGLSGGIGFATWDHAIGNSEIAVHSVGVVSEIYNLGTPSLVVQ